MRTAPIGRSHGTRSESRASLVRRAALTTFVALLTLAAFADLGATATAAVAAPEPTDDDGALFRAAVQQLHAGKAGEAVADFEALADHGVLDATVSFDRGLAYVSRVRVGGEQAGDLGEAAHGFVEAKGLAKDRALVADATRALGLVRAEVGRRRARAGESVEFDPGLALGPTFLRLVPEDDWAILAVVGSLALGSALFVRRAARERRSRIGATLTAALATVVMALGVLSTFAARHQRLTVTPGVIVSGGVRPTDERGRVLPNAPIVPEAADVELLQRRAGLAEVRWGNLRAWVPAGSVRPVAL